MKVAVFNTKPYDRESLDAANAVAQHELVYLEPRLTAETAVLAEGCPAVCVFVNDDLNAHVLSLLAAQGTRLVALRCAGFNNVDVAAATAAGITVCRVPAYSPYAIAEHTAGLILTLNRKIHRSIARVREGNFALQGLLGFDLHGRTVGIIGTGDIGAVVARIMLGFGCRVLAHDPVRNPACEEQGVQYVELPALLRHSDIVTLHCPLLPQTRHLINERTIAQMKPGVMLINTGRGALIDTAAAIEAMKSGQIGYLGLDVYEEEASLFFEDRSEDVIQDDVFSRLLTFPNAVITGHQAFFTEDALRNIAATTLGNVTAFDSGIGNTNEVPGH